MAIDGLVGSIEILGENLRIDLIPRVMESGRLSCTGQDQLRVLNYSYVPRVGQAIWGGGEDVFIEPRAEQIESSSVDVYHYRVILKPQAIVPDIDLETRP